MSNPRRRHFSRIVLWQECVGNILDLPSRYCLTASGPEVQEDAVDTIVGTERPDRRTHVIEVPLSEEETARLAEIMEELSSLYGHRVGVTLLGSRGAQHIQWAEPTSLRVLPESRDMFGMAASVLRLKTSVFHAAIQETENLLEPVPWEGTSTPGSASQIDGITTLAGSELAVYDDSEERVYLHTRWDEGTYRRFKTPQQFGPDVGMTAHVRGGKEELLMVNEGVDEIVRFDLTGTQLGVINPNNASGGGISPSGVTVANGDLVVIDVNDDLHIYDGVPDGSNNFANATSTASISSNTGKYISYDPSADLLFSIASTQSAREIRLHQGISSSITDTFSTQDRAGQSGLSAADGRLYLTNDKKVDDYGQTDATAVPTSAEDSAFIPRRMPLRVRGSDGRPERGYYGPTWRAGHECRVGIDGVPDTVSASDPIVLDYTLPIGTAEIELRNVTGELDGLAFNGTPLGLSGGGVASPPRLLLEGGKYSGLGINASSVWAVRARLESVASRPELVIYYAGAGVGDPRGALRGAYSETCVSKPKWTGANVEAIAFDVDADAGDELFISVTDAAGNYIGQISGDGDAVKGTSATFTYENAGVFTAEVVAEAFRGVVDFRLSGDVSHPIPPLLAGLPDLDAANVETDVTGDPTQSEMAGIERLRFTAGGTTKIDVSNLDTSIEYMNFRGSGAGLKGDWASLNASSLPNLKTLIAGRNTNSMSGGSLADLFSAAPNIELLRAGATTLFPDGKNLTGLHNSNGGLNRVSTNIGTEGKVDDLNHPSIPNLTDVILSEREIGGEMGNLPSQIEILEARDWAFETKNNLTWSTFSPSSFPNFFEMFLEGLESSHSELNKMAAALGNAATHLNGQSGGYSFIFVPGRPQRLSYDWPAPQHEFRAVGVKPNCTFAFGVSEGQDPTSHWKDKYAVAKITALPDSSTIEVDDPNSDARSDTESRDASADADEPLTDVSSGSELKIFEATSDNETGTGNPYLVSSVNDLGGGTVEINLDTTNGPSLTDTGSGGFNSDSRIVVTW